MIQGVLTMFIFKRSSDDIRTVPHAYFCNNKND